MILVGLWNALPECRRLYLFSDSLVLFFDQCRVCSCHFWTEVVSRLIPISNLTALASIFVWKNPWENFLNLEIHGNTITMNLSQFKFPWRGSPSLTRLVTSCFHFSLSLARSNIWLSLISWFATRIKAEVSASLTTMRHLRNAWGWPVNYTSMIRTWRQISDRGLPLIMISLSSQMDQKQQRTSLNYRLCMVKVQCESGIAVRGNDCEITLVIFPSIEVGPLAKLLSHLNLLTKRTSHLMKLEKWPMRSSRGMFRHDWADLSSMIWSLPYQAGSIPPGESCVVLCFLNSAANMTALWMHMTRFFGDHNGHSSEYKQTSQYWCRDSQRPPPRSSTRSHLALYRDPGSRRVHS